MRVVIDTNVLVSGILNPNASPGRILEATLSGRLTVLHDDRILNEYSEVLLRPTFGFRSTSISALLEFIESTGEHVSARDLEITLADESDLPFLEVAIAGLAGALVTGNLKHFKTKMELPVRICSPAEFTQSVLAVLQ